MDAKVSVIMGIYNCEKTLRDAVDSILSQTYANWELIMCDDGSTDSTYEIAREYQEMYPDKIILLKNECNMKLPATLNHCLKYVSGDFVARMDGDDKSYNIRFEKQVRFLQDNPQIDVVGTAMTYFDTAGDICNRYPEQYPSTKQIGMGVPFFHATIMMKTSVYKKLEGYSLKPYVLRCEDIDLWMRFFAAGFCGANLQDALYYVREDFEAVKRRHIKDGFNVSKMLLINYHKFNYPKSQYICALKPIISCLIPKFLKYLFNRYRWEKIK